MQSPAVRVLQCPVCANILKPPIITCTQGHGFCNGCTNKNRLCNICSSKFVNSRNYVVEDLCVLIDSNLPRMKEIPKIKKIGKMYPCAMNINNETACQWKGLPEQMKTHLSDKHALLEMQKFRNTVKVTLSVDSKSQEFRVQCLSGLGEMYFAVYGSRGSEFYFGVYYIGQVYIASWNLCEIKIESKQESVTSCLPMKDITHAYKVYQDELCFNFHRKLLEKFTSDGVLQCKICITRTN